MIYVELKREDFDFIKREATSFFVNYSGKDPIIEKDDVLFPVDDDSGIDRFGTALNFTIVHDGMDHQDTVNQVGLRLYNIYDNFEVVED